MSDKAETIPTPEIKKENLLAVMAHIEANPECHKQNTWHCGTSHCFGGWAQIMGGNEANDATVRRDARVFLGLTEHEATELFAASNSRPELRAMVDHMVGDGYSRDGYDRDGYDRAGYDSAGYDRDGYSRAGYDRDGYDRDGYDRDGYDLDGYSRAGYDSAGYSRDGYDRAGYSRAGYDRAGYDRDGYDRDGYDRDGLDPLNNPAP